MVIQIYITSAYRAYEIADYYRKKGAYVALGGLYAFIFPEEVKSRGDTIFLGTGEGIWPKLLKDFCKGEAKKLLN